MREMIWCRSDGSIPSRLEVPVGNNQWAKRAADGVAEEGCIQQALLRFPDNLRIVRVVGSKRFFSLLAPVGSPLD